jgi:hypothetical protein
MPIATLPLVLALASTAGAGPERTLADAWVAFSACEATPGQESEVSMERALACHAAARDVLRLGDESDRDRLWDRHSGLPAWETLGSLLFTSLVESYVADSVNGMDDAIAAAATIPVGPVATDDLPAAYLEQASPELKHALALFLHLWSGAWPQSTVPEGQRIAYQSVDGRRRFDQLVSNFLRGRGSPSEVRTALERFEWGGFCGNGASVFTDSVLATRLIASIREQRLDPHAATAFALGRATVEDGPLAGAQRRLLKAAGIDWETLLVGAVASGQGQHIPALAREGSDRAARLLLELVALEDQAPADERMLGDALTPLAGFVTAEGPCDGYATVSSEDAVRDPEAPPVDPHVQLTILDRLEQAVQPGVALTEAQNASHVLLRLCRGESREAFRAMLRSPYSQVRERGVLALRALGETLPDATASAPVAFRLLVDGRPWSGPVSWELEGDQSHHSIGTADGDGVLRMERDPFLDPVNPVQSVRLSSSLESPGDTWFSLRFRTPADLDARTLLAVRTGSLQVVVPPAARPGPAAPESAFLMLLTDDSDQGPDRLALPIAHMPVRAGRYVFPHLQQGRYQARVYVSDDEVLESRVVEVGDEPRTVELVPVPPAADEEEIEEVASPDTAP